MRNFAVIRKILNHPDRHSRGQLKPILKEMSGLLLATVTYTNSHEHQLEYVIYLNL